MVPDQSYVLDVAILSTCIFPAKRWFFPLNVELHSHAAVSRFLSVRTGNLTD